MWKATEDRLMNYNMYKGAKNKVTRIKDRITSDVDPVDSEKNYNFGGVVLTEDDVNKIYNKILDKYSDDGK